MLLEWVEGRYVLRDNRVDRLRLFVLSSNSVSTGLVTTIDASLVGVFSKAFEPGDRERFEPPFGGRPRLVVDGGDADSARGDETSCDEKVRKSDVNRIYGTRLDTETFHSGGRLADWAQPAYSPHIEMNLLLTSSYNFGVILVLDLREPANW